MDKVLVFGHKNPDTDSICSAIAYAELKNRLGMEAEAVRLGAVNSETEFVLHHFQVSAPRLVETVAGEVENVILVDHNEQPQSVTDIDRVRVIEVIDHHRIANFETSYPLYYRAEPVGCTATLLKKLYKENNLSIPQAMAGLMLSAIISDTLLFKSPTCTEQDVVAAHELAGIARVDSLADYGLEMLKAGANLSEKTLPELISMDAKVFQMGLHKVEIAQVNAVDVNDVLSRKGELVALLVQAIDEKQLDLFLFVVTDILNSDSVVLALGRAANAVEQAYHLSLVDHQGTLKGVVSRKKQIVPILTETLATFY
ncbi:manganese-dependent inorganic pyrophosphatase [Alicyclobacillaceae bacterium I2511]|jgi:manganese-dependent inorganic pyrophosphatase|nr:manganese-dependent inorganic pyrophosphatase [Alicyclobacillaceae bacterium I2511]